ncbi:MAG: DUF6057 family protein [Tannerella sp.]|nr:DUF6057 family protein [Tannerella sp.]
MDNATLLSFSISIPTVKTTMQVKMKYKTAFFWIALYVILFVFLQVYGEYHFYNREQNQLFRNTGYYLTDQFFCPGKPAMLLSGFLVQFYLLPYVGAAVTAGWLTGIGWLTHCVVKRIEPNGYLFFLSLLPVVTLLLVHADYNYQPYGTVAYLLMLIAIWLSLSIKDFIHRCIIHLLLIGALFYLAGPVYLLYTISVSIYELLKKSPHDYFVMLFWIEALLIGVSSVYGSIYGAYRFVFLPDDYYVHNMQPRMVIYFPWLALLLLILLACISSKRVKIRKTHLLVQRLFQIGCVAVVCVWGLSQYDVKDGAYLIAELDYYSRTEQWDKILKRSQETQANYLSICYVNRALAQQGVLGDKLFFYEQAGAKGILMPWDQSVYSSVLLSDIYFTMNHIALSQKMAFEAFVSAENPRMLQRLVQTNLIYGAYPVAEKYLDILEHTFSYRNWAKAHRKFLYNDAVVAEDPLLGAKKRSLTKNYISKIDGLDMDLQQIAASNPSDPVAIEYAGAIYLLEKDLDAFRTMIETYYGTEVLPALPVSFQEAVLMLSVKEPDYYKRFDIPEATVHHFTGFRNLMASHKNDTRALQGQLKRSYSNTYWYYHLYK